MCVCLFHYGYYFTEQNELALAGNLIFVFSRVATKLQSAYVLAKGGRAGVC